MARYCSLNLKVWGITLSEFENLPTDENGLHLINKDDVENGVMLKVFDDNDGHAIKNYKSFEGKWYEDLMNGGDGGGGLDEKPLKGRTASQNVGGVKNGDSLDMTVKQLLEKTYCPATAPLITIKAPTTTLYEKDIEKQITVSALITKQSASVAKVVFKKGGVVKKEIIEGVASGGTFNFEDTDKIKDTTTYNVYTEDANGLSNTKDVKLSFVYPSFSGICDSTTIDATTIKGGTKKLQVSKTASLFFIALKKHLFYAYPKEFGALTKITDVANNLPLKDSFIQSTVNVDGVDYYCYIIDDQTTCDNFNIAFE